jgi:hypothetical protein
MVLGAAVRAHAEPLVLDRGEIYARLSIEANLQTLRIARPLSFAPDVYVGATDRLTVGLIHSDQSVDRIEAGASFCVRELARSCDRAYHGSGLDVRWAWTDAVVPRVRLLLRDVDPMKPAVTAGALLRWRRARFTVTADPYLRVGLANRAAGNRDALVLPIWLGVRVGAVDLALHTGIGGDLAVWRDGWHVPIALVAETAPARAIVLGIEAGFPTALGPQNNGRATAIVYAGWRIR